MAKTIGAALQSAIADGTANLTRIFKVTRLDGTILRFTDHDEPIVVPSDGTYIPTTSFNVSSISSHITQGSSAADINIQFGASASQITKADARAGLYRNAELSVDLVHWPDPSLGTINLLTGWFGPFVGSDNQSATVQVIGFSQKAINRIGEKYSAECRAQLGDSRCGVNRTSFSTTGTVTIVVEGGYKFVATFASNPTAGLYDLGTIEWTSGANNGSKMEILKQENYDATDDLVLLSEALPYDIQVGDTFTALQGCDKRPVTCSTKFNNILNFRGEPFVPGPDFISDTPEPL